MLKIDNSLLEEVGLSSLPDPDKNSFLKHIYETLEMRVGIRLADQMSNEQLDEFERYFEAKDDAGAFKWLETNFPNYKDIVQEEFDKLKAEISQTAPQILSAAQGQAQQSTQVQQTNPATQSPPQTPEPVYQQPSPAAPQYSNQPGTNDAVQPQYQAPPQTPPPVESPMPSYPQNLAPPPQPNYSPQPQSPPPPTQPYQNPASLPPPPTPQYPVQQPPAGPAAQ
jgi:hypothetical protein